ncbi:MAG: SDR family NAD(P)-dependent oxidoreductase [Candidatus Wallbacteria bacterium]|nr:SDR family NAD(P)-dependent oxidoreductase [Candidatus Wallbacteria bacterium]
MNTERKSGSGLQGMRALVTGGAGGLGAEITRLLASQGATVMISYCTNCQAAENLRDELTACGSRIYLHGADITCESEVESLVNACRDCMGGLDILVNNAGVPGPQKKIENISSIEWRHVLEVNLTGPFLVLRAAIPELRKSSHGRVINIGSVSGQIGERGLSPYCSAKGGLALLTKTAAMELAGQGITVNLIAPGYIDAGMTRKELSEEIRPLLLKRVPGRRFGTAAEVAAAVAHLAALESSYINGQIIGVNGGVC